MNHLIDQMHAVAPPGQQSLDAEVIRQLQKLTARLLVTRINEANAEHARFLGTRQSEICLPEAELRERLGGAVVLVTGGTGCVGSALIRLLEAYQPSVRVVSLSRGLTDGPRYGYAEYRQGDTRDPVTLLRLFNEIEPDVVFHTAGQRDPGLAETEVHQTVTTNVFGTGNVLAAAAAARNTGHVVLASTGKALRLYSPGIYTASKRAAEWLAVTISDQVPVSAVRFAHIVDNSIIYRRLRTQELIRLHSEDAGFYVQSATSAAQLMLLASLDRAQPGFLPIRAITDLGWPVSLLDLALGTLARMPVAPRPIYLSGYDQGYESTMFPGIYDPATAGDVSPLMNALEAATVMPSACPMTDVFLLRGLPLPRRQLDCLYRTCYTRMDQQNPMAIRRALQALSWALLDTTLAGTPRTAIARMAERVPSLTSAEHVRVFAHIRRVL